MRSKAHIAGHPIHPMLIPLPITCVIGALIGDIVSLASGSYGWYFMSYVLTIGAWVFGLVAALPGLLDYFRLVPSRTRAKRDATIHMVFNVTIVGLYFVSWVVKNASGGSNTASLILEIIGTLILVASGWYGWTLVYKHRIGVDEVVRAVEPERAGRRKSA